MNDNDINFMRRALTLAQKAQGWILPNPMVGAVIVKNGKIIGEGYHKRAGLPHAEIEALNTLQGVTLKGTTLFVNLEPCAHTGRKPPCTDTIIKWGIIRVVCANSDPNPKVAGKGFAQLKRAGVRVTMGILSDE